MVRLFCGKLAPTKISIYENSLISIAIVAGLFTLFVPFAGSNQANDTTIRIKGTRPASRRSSAT